jgi:hypothetical protein
VEHQAALDEEATCLFSGAGILSAQHLINEGFAKPLFHASGQRLRETTMSGRFLRRGQNDQQRLRVLGGIQPKAGEVASIDLGRQTFFKESSSATNSEVNVIGAPDFLIDNAANGSQAWQPCGSSGSEAVGV